MILFHDEYGIFLKIGLERTTKVAGWLLQPQLFKRYYRYEAFQIRYIEEAEVWH